MKDQEHAVLVPVKPPAVGKSRLVGLPTDLRRELAVAFALDTVSACLATSGVGAVLAVTDDAAFSQRLAALGCEAVPDGVTGDLNACLRLAAAEAARRWPRLSPVAVCADLPALRPDELGSALGALPARAASFVVHGTLHAGEVIARRVLVTATGVLHARVVAAEAVEVEAGGKLGAVLEIGGAG